MKLLKDLYKISSPSYCEDEMISFLVDRLNEAGADVSSDESGNLYAVKGEADSYPCIVAHMDEVHNEKPKGFKIIDTDGMIFGIDAENGGFSGIGADDKNGIWVALKALDRFKVIKIAFFVAEEVGCKGSSMCDLSFFDDCRFVIQCDRRGGSDFISRACGIEMCSEDFINDSGMEYFGYSEAIGAMTDVYQLKQDGLKVSCVNLSCGYYNPHQSEEYTIISELENCLEFVENIIEYCVDVYPHEYKSTYSKYGTGTYANGKYSSPYDDKDYYNDDYYGSSSYYDRYEWLSDEEPAAENEVDQFFELIEEITLGHLTYMTPSRLYARYRFKYNLLSFDDFQAALEEALTSSGADYVQYKWGEN